MSTSFTPVGVAGIFMGNEGPSEELQAVGTVGFLDLRKFLLARRPVEYMHPDPATPSR